MKRAPTNRPLILAGVLSAVALLALMPASSQGQDPTQTVIANGGARDWIAMDPFTDNRYTGLNVRSTVSAANMSNQNNNVVVSYVTGNQRKAICATTLAPGSGSVFCGFSSRLDRGKDSPTVGGFVQVRATQPVLLGGFRETPLRGYEESDKRSEFNFGGPGFGAQTGEARDDDDVFRLNLKPVGVLEQKPFVWREQGCAPVFGSGCPAPPSSPPAIQKKR